MARKGSRKVRTGCITCKARKIKCDETKPVCDRCSSTGRRCDGYLQLPVPRSSHSLSLSASSGHHEPTVSLLRPSVVFPGASAAHDVRALQYFCQVAAPFLSGTMSPYFWTHVVMQLSTREPAVSHAVIAISSMYEQSQSAYERAAARKHGDQLGALRHYNASIRELRAVDAREKQPVVLLVCILFICIEVMSGNKTMAIRHCRHGIEILKDTAPRSSWTKHHLLPTFRRISEFCFYFGDEDTEFPDMRALEGPLPLHFSALSDAQLMLDVIFNRGAYLMRQIALRRSKPHEGGSDATQLLAEQTAINRILDLWLKLFVDLNARLRSDDASDAESSEPKASYESQALQCFLSARYEACNIWLRTSDIDQGSDGGSSSSFGRVLKQLLWLESKMPPKTSQTRPHFAFETGFGPMLFFLLSACRHLETRLEFLRLMTVFGIPIESLWEVDVLFEVGKTMIETEHGVQLDDSGRPLPPDKPAPPSSGTEAGADRKTRRGRVPPGAPSKSEESMQVSRRDVRFTMIGGKIEC